MFLLRVVIRLLPRGFRREYGAAVLETVRRRADELRCELGPASMARFWWRQGYAVVRAAVSLRRGQWRADENRRVTGGSEEVMDGLWQDVRQSLRGLAARPGFTIVAVLTLALGIGATTATFSAVHSVLLRPLPYRDVDRVVALYQVDTQDGVRSEGVSAANIRDLAESSTLLSSVAVAEPWSHDLMVDGRAVSLRSWAVSEGFFEAIGAQPARGRLFTPEEYLFDDGAGAQSTPAVILGHATWQSRFGGDPAIVGGSIVLDGAATTVVAVLPRGFKFPGASELWSPRPDLPWDAPSRSAAYMTGVARLAPGVTLAQARSETSRIAAGLAEQYPRANANMNMRMVPLREHLFGDVESPLLILLGAVGLVLMIVAANVAGLQLARGTGRVREYALRGALGAGSGRLLRLVTVESLLLAAAGCLGGIGLAYGGVEMIRMLGPDNLPRIDELAIDRTVLLFAVTVGVGSALAAGMVPALRASRTDLQIALSQGGRGATQGPGANRLHDWLVVGEVALALVLSIGAGLLVRSFDRVMSNELGFEPYGRLAVQVFAYEEDGTISPDFLQRALEEIGGVPGVEAVGVTTNLPLSDDRSISSIEINTPFTVDDRAAPPAGQEPIVTMSTISDDYPRVMSIPVTRGRGFSSLDNAESPPVIMINEALARRHFPEQDPVGERLTIRYIQTISREIVGVLADVRPGGYESEPRPEAYFPLSQNPNASLTYVIEAGVEPGQLAIPVQEAIWRVNPNQGVWAVRTMPDLLWDWMRQRSFNMAVLVTFAVLALSLAAIGVYGLMSFSVEQRVNELGIRRALGAEPRDILRMVLRRGALLGVSGVVLGLAGSLALTGLLRGMLFAVGPFDPVTFAGLSGVVVLVVLLAALVPARRATRIDPAVALRAE